MTRLVGRCIIWLACVWLFIADPEPFDALEKGRFFKKFSLLHLLWLNWMADMIAQLRPAKKNIALGSKKLFARYFHPTRRKPDLAALKQYIISTTKAAYRIFILWGLLIAALGILHAKGVLDNRALFMVSVTFYVCDLICVLIWCPFRLMLKNRCCTTCRIFNWDHAMMFTPMLFVNSFFSNMLLAMSVIVWLAWELSVLLHPERFWFRSNESLQCASCTDKLCTQYCQKLRPKRRTHA